MVAEPVAEEVVAQPESTPSTPPSEATLQTPSIQETPERGTGDETPVSGEGEGLEPTSKPLDQWTLQELNEKASREGLNAEELKRRDSLFQSVADRQREEQRIIAEAEERQRKYVADLTNEYAAKANFVREQLEALTNGQDRELTEERIARALVELRDKSHQIAEAPLHYDLDRLALSPQFFGDSVQNRRALAAQSVPEKIDALIRRSYELGRTAGPDENHVVLPKKELDERIKTERRKAIEEFRAANPGMAPPGGGGRVGSAGGWTYERWINATPEERRSAGPDVEQQVIRAEMRRRAGGSA